jgi:hypothetical protein
MLTSGWYGIKRITGVEALNRRLYRRDIRGLAPVVPLLLAIVATVPGIATDALPLWATLVLLAASIALCTLAVAMRLAPAYCRWLNAGRPRSGSCEHSGALPVESSGVVVAVLCPSCDEQLPADWLQRREGWSALMF